MAELVASSLRSRILSGELPDGTLLPKLDSMLKEFPVSRPSIRQAMRILETEGLVRVRRGNVGGAVVQGPQPDTAARMLGLVMQVRGVSLGDLAASIQFLEPLCIGLAATDPAPLTNRLNELDELLDQAEAVVEDGPSLTRIGRHFHAEIISLCPLQSLVVLLGVLEILWDVHEEAWAERSAAGGVYPELALRKASLVAHRQLVQAIREGNVERAKRLARRHLEATQAHSLPAESMNARISVNDIDPRLRKLIN